MKSHSWFAGKHFPLEKAKDAIEHTQQPGHGGKAFLQG